MATSNLGYQSFYQAQLTAAISDTDLTIPLDVVPTPSEGFLVLESTSSTKREIIYYTSKTSNSVVCPSGGRGYDGTTAQSHLQNSAVIMAPVAAMFSSMRDLFETTPQGWTPVTQTVSSVTYNGNRSYGLTMSSSILPTLSIGMRLRTRRTVSAPTQCTSLNGTTQYYSKTSPTGLTFTGNFTVSAWVKLTSYPGANGGGIIDRDSAGASGSGWGTLINSSGQFQAFWRNASGSSAITSFQSVPLNKWVHIAISANVGTVASTVLYFDGVSIPFTVTSSGANTVVQAATNLTIGYRNSVAGYFTGKLAQVALFSSALSQSTIRSYISQGLSGTETNLISAYSFNGTANDLNTTNANNLTAAGSAVATDADSPFTLNSFGAASGTLDFGIVTGITSATDITVQVPEGCTIPTSGGVSEIHYSTQKVPYNFPAQTSRWELILFVQSNVNMTTGSTTVQNPGGLNMTIPIGSWDYFGRIRAQFGWATAGGSDHFGDITNSSTTMNNRTWSTFYADNMVTIVYPHAIVRNNLNLTTATQYYILCRTSRATSISAILLDANMVCVPSTL